MNKSGFKLHSPYQPTGDQPEAIEALCRGLEEGKTGFGVQARTRSLHNQGWI